MINRLRTSNWRASLFFLCVALFVTLSPLRAQNVGFTASKDAGCAPLMVSFTNTSDNGAISYSWEFSNGGSSTTTHNADRLFLDPGVYKVTLTVTYAGGPISVSRDITVYANPSPAFAVSATSGCTPLQVQFTDQSAPGSGTIREVVWDFGDGFTANGATASHTYDVSGSFSISTIVTNSFGCTQGITKTRHINVGQTPAIDFTSDASGSCMTPLPVNFRSSGPAGLTYAWDFGDPASGAANTSAEEHPAHTYTQEGRYTVTLRARTAEGCEAVVAKQTYIVIEKTRADFSVQEPACAGAMVTLVNQTLPRPSLSTWTLPDGSSQSGENASFRFNSPGNYQVTLNSGMPGCMETVTKTITIHESPQARFSATPPTGCSVPFTTRFSPQSPGANAWQWAFGDGTVSTEESPIHTYTAFGNYRVSLQVRNQHGCQANISIPDYIRIEEPRLSVTISQQEGCLPLNTNFTAALQSAGTITAWHWDFGDGAASTDPQPSHTYTTQGRFPVRLTAQLAGGCQVVYDTYVRAGEIPMVDFDATPKTPCASEPVHFTNLSQPRGTEWQWTFPQDGGSSGEENPIHDFHVVGLHTVTLQVSNYGCRRTLTKPDFINIRPPAADFSFNQVCTDKYSVTFRDNSDFGPPPVTARLWKWEFGDGTTSADQHPVHVYTAPGLYTVRLTVGNGDCEDEFERQVHIVDERPVLHADKAAVCAGDPVVISRDALAEPNIRDWYWTWGDNTFSPNPGNAISKTYSNPGTYAVTLRITDINNCVVTSAPISIQVNGATAGFDFSGRNCKGDEITFADASTAIHNHDVVSWTWTFGDGSAPETVTSRPLAHKHAFAATGTYNVRLEVLDNAGCRTQITRPVPVTGVTADFMPARNIACLKQEMLFSNRSTGNSLQYEWDFGDNTTSTATHPLKIYTAPGQYSVTLKVTGIPGCTEIITKNQLITVPDPQAKFSVPGNLAECPPVLVQTTNQSTGFIRSVWNFGDGSRSVLESPSHVYNLPGTYTIQLQVYSEGDCVSATSKEVKIDGPTGTSSWTPNQGCVPLQASFSANSPNAVKYIWDFDNGTVLTTSSNTIRYQYEQRGIYQPRVILEDAKGCQVTAQGPRPDIVVDQVKAAFVLDDSRACDAGEVFFTDQSSSLSKDRLGHPHTFRWDFGYDTRTDDISSLQNPAFLYSGVGSYTARVEVTSIYGCKDEASAVVKVEPLPQAAISPVNPVCAGDSVRLAGRDLKNLAGTQWAWMVDGQPYTATGAPRLAFREAGLHTVQLVVRNASGKCPSTASVSIAVNPLPQLNVTPRQAGICLGQSQVLQSNAGNAQLTWTDYRISGTTAANPTVSPLQDTMYRVRAINSFGCISRDSMRITVSQPFVVQAANVVMCSGKPTQLQAGGAISYRWLPAAGLSRADVPNPQANPANTTRYQVVGYGRDNCFTDTADVLVTVHPSPEIRTGGGMDIAAGTSQTLNVQGSGDVVQWAWFPNKWISCADCPNPVITPKGDVTYNITAVNRFGCQTIALLPINLVCPGSTAFIPNSFSPNGDGQNDVFYVRGGGIAKIKSFKIFNRWGQMVFERTNCNTDDPSCGWDGRFNGHLLNPDVYIYFAELTCDTNEPLLLKGNVTVLR